MHKAGPLEVKTDAQLGSHQRGVAEPAKEESEVARKSGGSRLEKRTTLLTNTAGKNQKARRDGRTLTNIRWLLRMIAKKGIGLFCAFYKPAVWVALAINCEKFLSTNRPSPAQCV